MADPQKPRRVTWLPSSSLPPPTGPLQYASPDLRKRAPKPPGDSTGLGCLALLPLALSMFFLCGAMATPAAAMDGGFILICLALISGLLEVLLLYKASR